MPTVPYPGLPFSRGIQPTNKGPVDAYIGPYGHNSSSYGPAAGSTGAGICLANDTIAPILRYVGQSVIIHGWSASEGATYAYLYWYRGGTADGNLELFSAGSVAAVAGASLGENTFTGLNTFNAGITTSFIYASTGSTFGGRVDVAGILDVAGGVTLESTLDVTSVAKFNSNVILGDENTDTVTATGTFQGLTVSNRLLIANAGITTSFIYASTGSTFGARVDVAGILDVAGGVTLENTLDVAGVAKFVSGVTFQSTTDHAGVARFAAGLTTSALDVTGVSKFNGNITLGDASGDTVTATATFQGLTVSNNPIVSTAGITTSFIYASTGSTFGGRVDVAGILDVVGGVTFENTSDHAGVARFAAGITSSTLDVTNLAKFNSNVTIGDNAADVLTVTSGATFGITDHSGAARFASTVTTTGILTASGGITASTLDVTNLAKFNSNVTVGDNAADVLTVTSGATFGITDHSGIARFAAGLTTSTLDVTTISKFAGGATFASTVAVVGGLSAASLYASTGSTFGGNLVVNGGATFATTDHAGVARFAAGLTTSTLDVVGIARFAGGSTFSGIATFTSGITTSFIYASTGSTFGARVDVAGILDVVGGVTLENNLDVAGVARFTAGITTSTLNASQAIRANGGLTASTLDVEGVSKFAGGTTFSSPVDFASAARFAVGLTSSGNVVVGSAGTVLKTNGDATIGATLTVNGNFFVAGTVTTVNRTDLAIDDKIITLGRTLGDDTLADDGGLVLVGDDDIKLTWRLASDAWTSSRNFNVNTGSGYKVSNTTALAVGMVHGLSASAGIITGGTWAANIIGLAYGGTNKNLAAVGASGGVVYKDGTGLTITAAGSSTQILQVNGSGAPVWVNTTSLTGITADRVKTTATNTAGTYYLTFVTAAADSTDLYVDTTTGVTYDASTGLLSCTQLEAIVDGGTF